MAHGHQFITSSQLLRINNKNNLFAAYLVAFSHRNIHSLCIFAHCGEPIFARAAPLRVRGVEVSCDWRESFGRPDQCQHACRLAVSGCMLL